MSEKSPLFVKKCINSSLLTAFFALIGKVSPYFSLAPESYRGLVNILEELIVFDK